MMYNCVAFLSLHMLLSLPNVESDIGQYEEKIRGAKGLFGSTSNYYYSSTTKSSKGKGGHDETWASVGCGDYLSTHETIQDAIDDEGVLEVYICEGVYTVNLVVANKSVKLIGHSTESVTLVPYKISENTLRVIDGSVVDIIQLTIDGQSDQGILLSVPAVHYTDSSGAIKNVVVQNYFRAAGVTASNDGSLRVDTTMDKRGSTSKVVIKKSRFENISNTAILAVGQVELNMYGCEVIANEKNGQYGICIVEQAFGELKHNRINGYRSCSDCTRLETGIIFDCSRGDKTVAQHNTISRSAQGVVVANTNGALVEYNHVYVEVQAINLLQTRILEGCGDDATTADRNSIRYNTIGSETEGAVKQGITVLNQKFDIMTFQFSVDTPPEGPFTPSDNLIEGNNIYYFGAEADDVGILLSAMAVQNRIIGNQVTAATITDPLISFAMADINLLLDEPPFNGPPFWYNFTGEWEKNSYNKNTCFSEETGSGPAVLSAPPYTVVPGLMFDFGEEMCAGGAFPSPSPK